MADADPLRWSARNDRTGENRKRRINLTRYKAYERSYGRFKRGVDKLKARMARDVKDANRIKNQESNELEETLQREQIAAAEAETQEAASQTPEDDALETSKDKKALRSLESIKEATIETLNTFAAIVEPVTGVPRPRAPEALSASASTGPIGAFSHTPSDLRVECITCGQLPPKGKKGSRTREGLEKQALLRAKAEATSPPKVEFEIESESLLNGALMNNHFVHIPKAVLPVELHRYEALNDFMGYYTPMKIRADDKGWYVDFGTGSIGLLPAGDCFEGLKKRMFGRKILKVLRYKNHYQLVESA